jgi:FtsP/CotA-like multicopper oxidase with cupredoxin domain
MFDITAGNTGRWPRAQWRRDTTEIVGVGQTRDIEFVAKPGDWALHCHMSHHTMNAMGHEMPNVVGADLSATAEKIQSQLPGYMAMGANGMAEHQQHLQHMNMPGPANTLPMMMGVGPHGNLEMGGMFTVVKVREELARSDYHDPGWYNAPTSTMAKKISEDADFGRPVRRDPYAQKQS